MTLKDAINNLRTAPDNTLIILLLKQFKGLLAEHGIELDTQGIHAVAEQASNREELSELGQHVKATLVDIVEESMALLRERFKLKFPDSMTVNANLLTGWRTPSEFQEIITHKTNAETRITMGATLLAMLGDNRYIAHVFTTMESEYIRGHTEAMLAMRALSFAAKLDPATEDWDAKIREILLLSD